MGLWEKYHRTVNLITLCQGYITFDVKLGRLSKFVFDDFLHTKMLFSSTLSHH
jgi:hypothetical protein